MSSLVKTLEYLELQFGIFHGGITPHCFFLISGLNLEQDEKTSYAILDIGMSYWYDQSKSVTSFLKNFSENG